MEEHDDPRHPVVVLAKERITELSTRRKTVEDAVQAPKPCGRKPSRLIRSRQHSMPSPTYATR
jgi:hypothetical protein